MINIDEKPHLIESATILFHQKGLSTTSLADIAKHADIPIGNVYYYFKTKEELALAVVKQHAEQYESAYKLLDDNIADPRSRLIEATRSFDKKRDSYARYGCPVVKLIDEGDVAKDNVTQAAAQVLTGFIDWARKQFILLGHGEEDASRYAASLLAGIQGGILLAKTTQNPQALSDETIRLVEWLASIPNKKIQIGKIGAKA